MLAVSSAVHQMKCLFAWRVYRRENLSGQLLKVCEAPESNLDRPTCWYETIKLWFVVRHNFYVLFMARSLIDDAARVCRECGPFGVAQYRTIMGSGCQICSLGAGSPFESGVFEQCYPEAFLSQCKLQVTAYSRCNFSDERMRMRRVSSTSHTGENSFVTDAGWTQNRFISQWGERKHNIYRTSKPTPAWTAAQTSWWRFLLCNANVVTLHFIHRSWAVYKQLTNTLYHNVI